MQETIPPFLALLRLGTDADDRAIRRAYAQRLKQIDQEAEPEEFQTLRQAYEAALLWHAHRIPDAQRVEFTADANEKRAQRGTEIAPGDQPSAAGELESLPGATAAATQRDTPQSAGSKSEHMARTLIAEMREKLASGWPGDQDDVRAWLDLILGGDRLLDMDARFLFEWGVAGTLAEGWQPGKEFLFGAAMEGFGWRDDRGRLMAFGRAGEVVAAAIAELEFLDSLAHRMRDDQRRAIRALRDDTRPTTSALLTLLPIAEHVTQFYPHLLHIVTNTRNLERWRQWTAQIPKWRRRFSRKPRTPTVQPETGGNNLRWAWGLMIVVALSSLGKFADHLKSPPPMSPGSNHAPFPGLTPPAPSGISSGAQNSELERLLTGMPPKGTPDDIPTPFRQGVLDYSTTPMERPAIDASYLIPPKLSYPPLARRRGQEGRVILTIIVDPEGKVRHAKVDKSSGHAILDEAAITAVQAARFNPAKNLAGAAIPSSYKLPFNFKLSDEPAPTPSGPRNYGDAVRDAVLPHIVFSDPSAGNPVAEVTLQLAPDGHIQSHRLTRPSGNSAWDAAVLRALQRVRRLPTDHNGKAPPEIIIAFKPQP